MRFRDFDIFLNQGYFERYLPAVNLRYRAFVEAVISELRAKRAEAPWIKLYVDIVDRGRDATFMPAIPKVGLSSAGVTLDPPTDRLLTSEGEAVRAVLAEVVLGTRELIRERSGWDDPGFWEAVRRAGEQRGRYEHRLLPVNDRSSGLVYHLTKEWDEFGTTVYVDLRHAINDDVLLGRAIVDEFPGVWELDWMAGFAPRKLRIGPDRVEVFDRAGVRLGSSQRPNPE